MTRQSNAARRWFCIAIAGLGLLTSGYLLTRTFTVLQGQQANSTDICSAVFGANCDSTLLSDTSWQFGIPIAGWGVIYYVALLVMFFMGIGLRDTFENESRVAAVLLSTGGLAVSMYLAFTMISGAAPYCPLCALTHAINLALLGVTLWADGRGPRSVLADTFTGLRYLLGAETKRPDLAPWKLTGFIATALVGVILYQWVFIRTQLITPTGDPHVHEDVFAEYQNQPLREIPIRPDDPRLGSRDARIQVVVFSDFQCPYCSSLAHQLEALHEQYRDDVSIVFKHYPLGRECNDSMNSDFHPYACSAAYAAEAAREQGLFWPFHDVVFDSELSTRPIREIAYDAGLDLVEFDESLNRLVGRRRVREDVALGNELGLIGTPSVFINGRESDQLDVESLQTIVSKLLSTE